MKPFYRGNRQDVKQVSSLRSVPLTANGLADDIKRRLSTETVNLCFDFDGTVAEYQSFPEDAFPHPVAMAAYQLLSELAGARIGVITGRRLDFADPMFPSNFDLHCSYGVEGRQDGQLWRHPELIRWQPALDRFTQRLIGAVKDLGLGVTFSSHEAAETDAIYLERKPASLGVHDAPARSTNPATEVSKLLPVVIDALNGDFEGLNKHINNGNFEFSAAICTADGKEVDKGTVVDQLKGFIVFSCDDTGDLPAAIRVREQNGVVLAINHQPDAVRRGSPPELIATADLVFASVDEHAKFISALAHELVG